MPHPIRLSVPLLMVVLASTACGGDDDAGDVGDGDVADGAVEIEGREWDVLGVGGAVEEVPPTGTPVTLRIEDGTISGTSGCNSYSGSVTVDGSSIEVADELILTRMACGETQDWNPLLELLPQATDFARDGDTVVINTSTGSFIILG